MVGHTGIRARKCLLAGRAILRLAPRTGSQSETLRCSGTSRVRLEEVRTVQFTDAVDVVGKGIDTAGVGVMVIGAIVATGRAVTNARQRLPDIYRRFRQQLGRSILLGLELLVAADIIRTVAVTPTLSSVLVLALIVAIRTFLSFSLELEITGRWPWQTARSTTEAAGPP
jgi:uncharacterized membrane protein